MFKKSLHSKSIACLMLLFALLAGTANAETKNNQLADFKLTRDSSVDAVYLVKSNKIVAGVGVTPITLFDKTFGVRFSYINDLRDNLTDDDMAGLFLQANIVKIVGLIPKAQWQLPDLGIKLGVGYIVNIETMNFKRGEPAISVSAIKLF